MALGFGDSVLPDLVEQSFVADLQKRSLLFAIPVSGFQSLADCFSFRFVLGGAGQRFQSRGFVLSRLTSGPDSPIAIEARLQLSHSKALIPQDQITLQKIIESAQVARPRMGLASLQ